LVKCDYRRAITYFGYAEILAHTVTCANIKGADLKSAPTVLKNAQRNDCRCANKQNQLHKENAKRHPSLPVLRLVTDERHGRKHGK
jgi:hypothetical protein